MEIWKKEDWGNILLKKIDNGKDFWCLIDELIEDETNNNTVTSKDIFADAFLHGIMYSFRVEETESMFYRKAHKDSLFCKGTRYLLPAVCVKDRDAIIIFWVHRRIKKMGFQRIMMDLLLKQRLNELPFFSKYKKPMDEDTESSISTLSRDSTPSYRSTKSRHSTKSRESKTSNHSKKRTDSDEYPSIETLYPPKSRLPKKRTLWETFKEWLTL
jgi:hypothetical protein